jgi:hypothetical protein
MMQVKIYFLISSMSSVNLLRSSICFRHWIEIMMHQKSLFLRNKIKIIKIIIIHSIIGLPTTKEFRSKRLYKNKIKNITKGLFIVMSTWKCFSNKLHSNNRYFSNSTFKALKKLLVFLIKLWWFWIKIKAVHITNNSSI